MIKVFSIEEITQASNNILNSQNPKKLINKKNTEDKEKLIPTYKNNIVIKEEISNKKPLIFDKEIKKSVNSPQSVEKMILKAEKNQFKIFNKKKEKKDNLNYQKIIDELYVLLNKKIKKNTLKLIVDLRNNIVSLDKRILSLKKEEQKITNVNKLLREDIKNLTNNEDKLKYIIQKKI